MNESNTRITVFLSLSVLCLGLTFSAAGKEATDPSSSLRLTITNVSLEKKSFDPMREQGELRFKLSAKARACVRLYDIDDFLVRNLILSKPADRGYSTVTLDGKDDEGKWLAPGAYTYVIEAESLDSQERTLYDRADQTYGRELTLRSLSYDSRTGKIEYVLPKAAMLRIRAGMKDGGPLLATLVDWQPRQAGRHRYVWDGNIGLKDMDLRSNPNVEFNLAAYSLADNSIIIRYAKPPSREPSTGKPRSPEKRPKRAAGLKKYFHAIHPKTNCREPQFKMEFPNATEYTSDGAPIVGEVFPVRITLDEQDKKLLENQRYEIVLFTDFVFLFEEEDGISPYTYFLDTKGMGEGKHLLTVNIYSFKDHLGTKTKWIHIRR